ncbi:MAG: hypothetical protein J5506_00125 [Prevotella sp.]|nr:hypothetical protein [Prevotella sp.]
MKKKSLILLMALIALTCGCKEKNSSQPQQKEEAEEQTVEQNANTQHLTPNTQTTTDMDDAEAKEPDGMVGASGFGTPPSATAKPIVYSIAEDGFLNIREMPVPGSKIVGKLTTGGEGAEYLGSTSKWHNVKYHGVEGYVNGNYAELRGLEELSTNVPEAKGRKVYYVVLGSFTDLAKAKQSTEVLPDALDGNCIYRTTDKGKTIYRLCLDCYYSRDKAQKLAKSTKEFFGRDVWVWESQGVAPCVYQGILPSGEPARMTPEP